MNYLVQIVVTLPRALLTQLLMLLVSILVPSPPLQLPKLMMFGSNSGALSSLSIDLFDVNRIYC